MHSESVEPLAGPRPLAWPTMPRCGSPGPTARRQATAAARPGLARRGALRPDHAHRRKRHRHRAGQSPATRRPTTRRRRRAARARAPRGKGTSSRPPRRRGSTPPKRRKRRPSPRPARSPSTCSRATSTTYKVKRSSFKRVEYFEDMLLDEGERYRLAHDYARAFECYLRVQARVPGWPGLDEHVDRLLFDEGSAALNERDRRERPATPRRARCAAARLSRPGGQAGDRLWQPDRARLRAGSSRAGPQGAA